MLTEILVVILIILLVIDFFYSMYCLPNSPFVYKEDEI